MRLWQKLWLLFTVIWVIVAALQVFTIVAFSEGEFERDKAILPIALAFIVPVLLYGIGWAWERWRKPRKSGSEPD